MIPLPVYGERVASAEGASRVRGNDGSDSCQRPLTRPPSLRSAGDLSPARGER